MLVHRQVLEHLLKKENGLRETKVTVTDSGGKVASRNLVVYFKPEVNGVFTGENYLDSDDTTDEVEMDDFSLDTDSIVNVNGKYKMKKINVGTGRFKFQSGLTELKDIEMQSGGILDIEGGSVVITETLICKVVESLAKMQENQPLRILHWVLGNWICKAEQ